MYFTFNRLLLYLCVLFGAFFPLHAQADTTMAARKIELPGVSLQDVQVRLTPGADPNTVQISLDASHANLSALGWRHVGLKLDGTLRRDAQLRWLFAGTLQATGAPGGGFSHAALNLVVDASANTLEIDAHQDATAITTAIPLDQPTHAQISLTNLPANWLQGLLGTVSAGRISAGKLNADLAVDDRDSGIQASGDFDLQGLGFEIPGINVASQALVGHGRFGVDGTGHPVQFELNGTLRSGQLRLGSMLAQLPGHDVQLDMGADVQRSALSVSRLHVDDADALQIDGALAVDAKGNLQRLKFDHVSARFPAAYVRYGQGWLSTGVLQGAQLAGQLDGHLDYDAGGLRSFAFHADGLDVADATGRLSVSGLRGGLDWSAQGERLPTTVQWNRLTIYRIVNGPGVSHWRSHDGDLALLSPFDEALFNGHLDVNAVNWRPAAAKEKRLALSLAVTGIDFAAFSRALGWPQINGTLVGTVPVLRWIDNRVALDGGFSVKTFGGSIDISRMTLQQPFGANPILNADIALRQLDLAAITRAFDFGSISGHLNGSIDALQLADWNPVAFNASLRTDGGGHISQRAVNNLNTLTGSTVDGSLQGAMLRLFKGANYNRMGLNCTLQDNICHMGGLEDGPDGYTIAEGGRLPSVKLVSRQTQIEWPALMRRLKSVTQASAP